MSKKLQDKEATHEVVAEEIDYFQKRMDELGVTPENNIVRLKNREASEDWPRQTHSDCEIFSRDKHGNIQILVYDINAEMITYEHKGDGKMSQLNAQWLPYYVTRLKNPIADIKGDIKKYNIPKGVGTFPFFPPALLEKYNTGETIDTLIATEGFFKAFKGAMHGLDIIGLSSITHYKDKATGELHADIIKLIKKCKVKKFVWLQDGDCLNITSDEIDDTKDLYKRPSGFFSSAKAIKTLLDDYDVEKIFAHIQSDNVKRKSKRAG